MAPEPGSWQETGLSPLEAVGKSGYSCFLPVDKRFFFLVLNNSSEYSTFLELQGGVLDDATLRIDRLQQSCGQWQLDLEGRDQVEQPAWSGQEKCPAIGFLLGGGS